MHFIQGTRRISRSCCCHIERNFNLNAGFKKKTMTEINYIEAQHLYEAGYILRNEGPTVVSANLVSNFSYHDKCVA